jgi:hypothetical protein
MDGLFSSSVGPNIQQSVYLLSGLIFVWTNHITNQQVLVREEARQCLSICKSNGHEK